MWNAVFGMVPTTTKPKSVDYYMQYIVQIQAAINIMQRVAYKWKVEGVKRRR